MSFLTWNGSRASAAPKTNALAKRKASASATAAAAAAAAHSPKLDDYKRVPPEDVPHQSFKGYQICANLEPETSELIGLASEYPTRPYTPSYRLFEQPTVDKKGFHTEQNNNLALFQKVDTDLGTRSYVVRAARDLKKGTPVCLVGGQLTELWKAEPHVVSDCGYVMTPADLHDYFFYPRDQTGLVLLTDRHYNISKFVRDPSHRTKGEGPNVTTDLILHKKAKLFVLLLFTTANIAEGEEIFAHRFLGDSRKHDHQNMVLAARVSHWHHRYAARLERAALDAHIQPSELEALHKTVLAQATRKNHSRKLLTAAEQRMHMRGVDSKQKSVPVPPSISQEEMAAAKAQLQRDSETADEPADGEAAERIKNAHVYHYFLRAQSDRLMAEGAEFRDGTAKNKHISDLWRALSEEEKAAVRTEMLAAKGTANVDHGAMAAAAARARHAMADLMPHTTGSAASTAPRAQAANGASGAAASADEGEEESKEERKECVAASSSASAATAAAASSAASASSASALAAVAANLGGGTSETIERDLLRLVSVDEAMRLTGCVAIPKSTLGDSVTQSTRILMARLAPQYPTSVVIDGQRHPFDSAKMEAWLAEKKGFDEDMLEVREIQSLTSPCRYFVPPWFKTFCVTSRAAIPRASLLCIYSGEMEQSVQHRCSSYVYSLPTSEGVSHFGKDYAAMPDLIVDAANKGNIGRFFNDNSFRNGEYQCAEAVNVGVTWVFDLVPHLVFYATRDIAPGEELISTYGKQFWDVMCRQSLRGHSAYFAYIRPYTSGLAKLLKARGAALPAKPDFVIEREPLFEQKVAAYEPPDEDSDDDDDDDDEPAEEEAPAADYTVERVVGKKFLRDEAGSVRYLLKWTGYPWEDNTWEPLSHLEESMEAVHEFEQKLKARGMDVGVEPLDGPQPDDLAAAVGDESADANANGDADARAAAAPVAMDVDETVRAERAPARRAASRKKGSRGSRKRQSTAAAAAAAASPSASDAAASPAAAAAAHSGVDISSASSSAPAAASASPVSDAGLDAGVGAIDLTADDSESAAALPAPKKRRARSSASGGDAGAVGESASDDAAPTATSPSASPPRKRAQRAAVARRSQSPSGAGVVPATAAAAVSAGNSAVSPSHGSGGALTQSSMMSFLSPKRN